LIPGDQLETLEAFQRKVEISSFAIKSCLFLSDEDAAVLVRFLKDLFFRSFEQRAQEEIIEHS
jgi:hypothetical protein